VEEYSDNDLLEPMHEIKDIDGLATDNDLLELLENGYGREVEWADISDEDDKYEDVETLEKDIKDIIDIKQKDHKMQRTKSFEKMVQELSKIVAIKMIYKCDVCEKVCTTAHHLKEHHKYCHKSKLHCGQCVKEFTTGYTLKLHKLNYHFKGEELFSCLTCEKKFKHPFLLTDHEKYCVKVKAKRKKHRKPTYVSFFFVARNKYEANTLFSLASRHAPPAIHPFLPENCMIYIIRPTTAGINVRTVQQ
jgi:hypothetical protein